MSEIELNEKLLAEIAGWEAMKQARTLAESRKVLSASWKPPVLRGVVEAGSTSYRCGLVIKSRVNVDNLCTCRPSREWGTICHHSVAIGLEIIRKAKFAAGELAGTKESEQPAKPSLKRNQPEREKPKAESRFPLKFSDKGIELSLSFILPPNLEAALAKGTLAFCVQGETARGTRPLDAIDPGVEYKLSAEDEAILRRLVAFSGGQLPGMLMLDGTKFAELLDLLAGHERLTISKSTSVTVDDRPWAPPIRATISDAGEIELELKTKKAFPPMVVGKRVWIYSEQSFQPLALSASCTGLMNGMVVISRAQVPAFLNDDWPSLADSGAVDASFSTGDFKFDPQPPRFILNLEGGLAQLRGQLQCAYGKRIMTIGVTDPGESFWLPDPEDRFRYSTRDIGAEQAAWQRLAKYGFQGPNAKGQLELLGQNQVLTFFAAEYGRLEREWEVTLESRLEWSMEKNIERVEPSVRVTPAGEQWFDMEVNYSSRGGGSFSKTEIQQLLLSGQKHKRLANGKFAILDTGAVEELQEVLVDCDPQQSDGAYRLASRQASFLVNTIGQSGALKLDAPVSWRRKVIDASGEVDLKAPDLGALNETLRPYQKDGVAWMCFLREHDFGGILADEMGLGKTLQVLAYLNSRKRDGRRRHQVGPHWSSARRALSTTGSRRRRNLLPELRVLALHGSNRSRDFDSIGDHDLIVTSYALIRRDADVYARTDFDTVILDEAQHIKNRQTQNARSVKSIRAAHRLVLTGTPLENSVLDLWSIFDFLMPGYLGADRDFRERYEIPIVRDKDANVQARLARRIKPFMVRRLKRDVAADLPDKIEKVAYCELSESQQSLYRELLETSRSEIHAAVGEKGASKSRMVMLNALLRLRQISCDPRLLKLDLPKSETVSSKVELFEELLEESMDGGHRVLVFSQFVEMLKLLRDRLDEREIDYCYLDGSTKNRGEEVKRFQTSNSIPLFLISLKAGGVGLNLTGADTVMHFDPWWNPAVEDQATDRAHRIGQKQVVTSYKLIARGTVEEKILKLQERKREVIQGVLGDDASVMDKLTWEEIQSLFE